MKLRIAALLLGLSLAGQAQKRTLGHIEFPTSASGEVQEHFIQGVLWLHSFEYGDAREEFQAASRIDPNFAMAYWGEALTFTHPVWVEQDASAGRAALARLAPTREARLAKAPSQREKDYLGAVEILYGPGDKVARDIAYAEAMRKVMKAYPDDLEAATLYSVALLGTCESERQFPVYMRAAAIDEEVFAKNPQHPGAVHYLIHAYDDPVHAPLGLRPARVYAKLAGSASHALHMPSHIFFALGMWDEANATNEESVRVADERVKRKALGPDQRNYHSLLWLEYGYLQEGRQAEARRVLTDLAQSAAETQSRRALTHVAFAQAAYTTETGQFGDVGAAHFEWAKAPAGAEIAVLTAQGLVAARSGKRDEARTLYMEAKRRSAEGNDETANAAVHGSMPMATAPRASSPSGDKASAIMLEQLEAAILWTDGKRDEALVLFAKTAAEEDALTFEFGPPAPVKPAHELNGEMLLAAGRPREAQAEFERALSQAPRRALAMQGLAKAAKECGDMATAQRTFDDLKTFWRGDL